MVNRELESLVTDGRPLSKDKQRVKELYEQRKDLYAFFADETIDNNGDIDKAVQGVVKDYENISN